MHARQAVVSGAGPACDKKLRVNSHAVVPYPQPKLPLVTAISTSDRARLRVPECIAHRLGSNPENLRP